MQIQTETRLQSYELVKALKDRRDSEVEAHDEDALSVQAIDELLAQVPEHRAEREVILND